MLRIFTLCVAYLLTAASHSCAAQTNSPPDKFVVFTPPKCGTHLVGKLLGLMFDQTPEYHLVTSRNPEERLNSCRNASSNNSFLVAHSFDERVLSILTEEGYKIIFILRDPRDQLLSMADWMREGEWHWLRVARMGNQEEQITEMITGEKFGWRCFEGTIKSDLSVLERLAKGTYYISRFEDLVGPDGGGDRTVQLGEILTIASFLGADLPLDKAESVANGVFGGTWTFRRGQIGGWRERFTPEQKLLYQSLYGSALNELGYDLE